MKFLISENDIEKRLDIFLTKRLENMTRSNIKKLIESKNVKINQKTINSPSKKIKKNDIIFVELSLVNEKKLLPSKIKLDIHFEDKDILIINKPKGMVVHPGAGNQENTLANALSFKYKNNLSNLILFK